jgi:adenosylhomocysteine nucleosidase
LLAFVAAEAREFSGLLRHAERVVKLNWPLDFARKIWLNGRAALLVANGPGPKLAGEAVEIAKGRERLTGLVSTGFCGALDPALKLSDIFVATEILTHDTPNDTKLSRDREGAPIQTLASARGSVTGNRPYQIGESISIDRVAVTASEKSQLRKTGAAAIEMEAAAVAAKAKEYNLPFYSIRVVTDTADENMPLDFNAMRDSSGRFSRSKIVAAAFRSPTVFPKLIKLNKTCKNASQALGDFIADTRF